MRRIRVGLKCKFSAQSSQKLIMGARLGMVWASPQASVAGPSRVETCLPRLKPPSNSPSSSLPNECEQLTGGWGERSEYDT